MKHPKTFRVFADNKVWTDFIATEVRADEHWVTFLDDAGNKLHLIKADRVEKVSLINDPSS